MYQDNKVSEQQVNRTRYYKNLLSVNPQNLLGEQGIRATSKVSSTDPKLQFGKQGIRTTTREQGIRATNKDNSIDPQNLL